MESTKSSPADKALTKSDNAIASITSRVAWLEAAVQELRIAAEGTEVSDEKYERIQRVWSGSPTGFQTKEAK